MKFSLTCFFPGFLLVLLFLTACKDEAEVLHEGNWELNEDLTTLTLNIGLINKDSKIVEITPETLKIEFQEMGQTIVVTYGAQN